MNRSNANFPNHSLCQGENLDFLRMMNSESVDLIATDPPFNSGRDYFADLNSIAKGAYFPDKWAWSNEMRVQHLGELEKINPKAHHYIKGVWQTLGDGALTSFLLFMSLRLVEMHRVLKTTGSIYLHCDHHASHYLKQLMDVLFGVDNFRNEIIWHHPKIGVAANKFTSNTDTIFFYSKGEDYTFSKVFSDVPNELYNRWNKKLDDGVLYYRQAKTINDSPAKSKIRVLEKKLGRSLKDDDVVIDFNDETNNKVVDNVWKVSFLKGNSKESTGYPTQKPLEIYERIVKASSNECEVVLDPFCGCATTLVAAENLGRQWIGIDIHPKTRTITANRIAKACKLNSPDGSVIAESTLLNLEKDLDIHVFNKKDFPPRTN